MDARQRKLAVVEGSPTAVAAHDKNAWLALFAPNGLVNDPVGSTPHRGADELSRFYDTFIAPNTVIFHPAHDIVSGDVVLRDLTLEIRMSDRVVLHVPAHLRYELTSDEQIAGLYAHWELPTMVAQMLRKGVAALPVSAQLTRRLLGNHGVGGAAGFGRGFVRVGAKQKRAAVKYLERDRLPGWTAGKCIAAGDYVTVSLTDGTAHRVAMIRFKAGRIAETTVFADD